MTLRLILSLADPANRTIGFDIFINYTATATGPVIVAAINNAVNTLIGGQKSSVSDLATTTGAASGNLVTTVVDSVMAEIDNLVNSLVIRGNVTLSISTGVWT